MIRVHLKVPQFYQQWGSRTCGQNAMKMVLAYHGIPNEIGVIRREMKLTGQQGTYPVEIGLWFLKNGFDVSLHTQNWMCRPSWRGLSTEKLYRRLYRWSARKDVDRTCGRTRYARALLAYLDAGGEFHARSVRMSDIEAALIRHEPPIVSVQHSMLCTLRDEWNAQTGHLVVPTGLRGSKIYYNDSWRECGQSSTHKEDFQNATAIWGGSAIFVSPQK